MSRTHPTDTHPKSDPRTASDVAATGMTAPCNHTPQPTPGDLGRPVGRSRCRIGDSPARAAPHRSDRRSSTSHGRRWEPALLRTRAAVLDTASAQAPPKVSHLAGTGHRCRGLYSPLLPLSVRHRTGHRRQPGARRRPHLADPSTDREPQRSPRRIIPTFREPSHEAVRAFTTPRHPEKELETQLETECVEQT